MPLIDPVTLVLKILLLFPTEVEGVVVGVIGVAVVEGVLAADDCERSRAELWGAWCMHGN